MEQANNIDSAILAHSAITGSVPNEATITEAVAELVVLFGETGVLSYFAHAFYNSAFRRQ